MSGFYFTNLTPLPEVALVRDRSWLLVEKMAYSPFTAYRVIRNQFLKDKLFLQDEDRLLISESVIMNLCELKEQYNSSSLEELVSLLLKETPLFFTRFIGMFSGVFYDKKSKRMLVFTDQLGNNPVFYYYQNGQLILGSELIWVTETMKANGIPREVDENAVRQFLTLGCFPDGDVYVKHVHRIYPGEYLEITEESFDVKQYHRFSEEPRIISVEEAVQKLDTAFRNAMCRGIKKNAEYGYTNLIDISGGADSRMIAVTAKALGCQNVILNTFAQSGSFDFTISQEIASRLDYEYVFSALDDAQFLKDIDPILLLNSGTAYYCGITGGYRMVQMMADRNVGLEYTGLLGDVHDSAMTVSNGDGPPSLSFKMSKLHDTDMIHFDSLGKFKTHEMYWYYTRGMVCGMSTFLTRQNYVEPFTPFGDLEFASVWHSIPWSFRVKEKIGLQWISRVYPSYAKIPYSHTGLSLQAELKPYSSLLCPFYRVLYVMKRKLTGKDKRAMNPFKRWEKEKPWLLPYLNKYFQDACTLCKESGLVPDALIHSIEDEFQGGNKYLAITVAGCLKHYIIC